MRRAPPVLVTGTYCTVVKQQKQRLCQNAAVDSVNMKSTVFKSGVACCQMHGIDTSHTPHNLLSPTAAHNGQFDCAYFPAYCEQTKDVTQILRRASTWAFVYDPFGLIQEWLVKICEDFGVGAGM